MFSVEDYEMAGNLDKAVNSSVPMHHERSDESAIDSLDEGTSTIARTCSMA